MSGYIVKFAVMFFGILGVIFVIAILTPKMAAAVDRIMRKIKPKPERVEDDIYKVRSIYDPPSDAPVNNGGKSEINENGDV